MTSRYLIALLMLVCGALLLWTSIPGLPGSDDVHLIRWLRITAGCLQLVAGVLLVFGARSGKNKNA